MRNEYILTKVRPIKKLFIIEPNDYDGFAKLFAEIQDEVDAIQNLIFVNDDDLWSAPNKEFIKRSDPDIILNLSSAKDEKLSLHFGIFSVKPVSDHWKISRFGTNLFSISRWPPLVKRWVKDTEDIFTVLSAAKLENSAYSLFACINLGMVEAKNLKQLKLSIFEKLKPKYLSSVEEIMNRIFDHTDKFSHITTELGGMGGKGYGKSIWEIDYNREGFYNDKKPYFFISTKTDFKTITYFWNTRSYYPFSNIAWIPNDYIKDIKSMVSDDTRFVCFDQEVQKQIKEQYPSSQIIQPTRLYFSGRVERWVYFEHTQTVNITDSEVIVQHPADKTFSDIGHMGAFVLETRGLTEFAYPKRRNLGKLFFPGHHDHDMFANNFQRISELGLSTYVLKITPLKPEDISESIVLPQFKEVIKHLFEDIGYTIKPTPKTSILQQTANLFGGLKELPVLAERTIFDLLVNLTPKVRTEKVVNQLLKGTESGITSENILEIIAEIREKGAVNFPSVTLNAQEILAKGAMGKEKSKALLPILQKLHDQRVFLRGKYFQCPHCGSNLWIQIDQINRVNYCSECNNVITLPVFKGDKQDSDYFRLNQLVVRAVDQGQLSTLLLLNLFNQQQYRAFEYQANLEIFKGEDLITDIDLVVKIGNRIGIAECKSTSGFNEAQVDGLIALATEMQCDFIAFSAILESTSPEIKQLVEILNKKAIDFPAFIFTNEVLFKPRTRLISKYFELVRAESFPVGAILVS